MVYVTSKLAEDVARNAGIPYKEAFHILLDMEHNKFKQLAPRIERYLLTDEQEYGFTNRGLTVLDVLHGNFKSAYASFVSHVFSEWDDRLGINLFTILAENG